MRIKKNIFVVFMICMSPYSLMCMESYHGPFFSLDFERRLATAIKKQWKGKKFLDDEEEILNKNFCVINKPRQAHPKKKSCVII